MAVYTSVTDEQLVAFLDTYDIGPLLSCKGIAEGVENSNFLLHTGKGNFILTLYEKRVNADDLPFFIGLMDHLSRNDFNCPRPVRQTNGEVLGTLAGRPAAIVTFLEGVSLNNPTPRHCWQLGVAMAQMHEVGQNFQLHRKNALSVNDWRPLFQLSGDRVDTIQPGLGSLIEQELDFLEARWPDHLPSGTIHADLFPDNVFFLQDELSGFIDFYFSCNDILAYDAAICINAWCFDEGTLYNQKKAEHFLSGYQTIRKFSNEERELFPVLMRGAAIRFLLTRVYDWLNVEDSAFVVPKDPIEYIKRVKFHQTITNFLIYGFV